MKAVIPQQQQQTTAQRILAAMEKLGPDADPLDIARLALDEARKETTRPPSLEDRYKRAVNALIEVCEEIHDLPYHLRQEIDEVLKEAEGVAYTVMR